MGLTADTGQIKKWRAIWDGLFERNVKSPWRPDHLPSDKDITN